MAAISRKISTYILKEACQRGLLSLSLRRRCDCFNELRHNLGVQVHTMASLDPHNTDIVESLDHTLLRIRRQSVVVLGKNIRLRDTNIRGAESLRCLKTGRALLDTSGE